MRKDSLKLIISLTITFIMFITWFDCTKHITAFSQDTSSASISTNGLNPSNTISQNDTDRKDSISNNEIYGKKIPGKSGICSKNDESLIWTVYDSDHDDIGDRLVISGKGVMADYSIFEPSPWDDYKGEITEIVLEKGITHIGDNAFTYFDNLFGSLELPTGLESIGTNAFSGCSFTGNLCIPDEVTTIGDWSFAGSDFDGSLVLSDNISVIGDSAFIGCIGLNGELTIPESVQEIGDNAFNGVNNISVIYNHTMHAKIGNGAFSRSNTTIKRTTYGLPKESSEDQNDLTLPIYTISRCVGHELEDNPIATVYGKEGATYTFCKEDLNISLPDGYVLDGWFLSNDLKEDSRITCNDCIPVTDNLVLYARINKILSSQDIKNITFENNDEYDGIKQKKVKIELQKIDETANVVNGSDSIQGSALAILPDSIPGTYTSYQLINIVLPNGCNYLLPENGQLLLTDPNKQLTVRKFNISACTVFVPMQYYTGTSVIPCNLEITNFEGKTLDLKKDMDYTITCNNNIKVSDQAAYIITGKRYYTGGIQGYFSICYGLEDGQALPGKNSVLVDKKTNIKYIVTKQASIGQDKRSVSDTGTVSCAGVTNKYKKKSISIPSNVIINGIPYCVTGISKNAFKGNKKIKNVNMGNSIIKIESRAFYKCKELSKITVPSKVKVIGKQAFYGCKRLKLITIKTPKLTKKSVGSKAFYGIHPNAVVKIPKKKISLYKKLLKSKGLNSKAKIMKQ